MDLAEPIKRLAEKATGVGIPSREEALSCVRAARPERMKFRDDGYIPNNPKFPLFFIERFFGLRGGTILPLCLKRCS